MGGVISLYKPTTTLQPEVLGFVWCTLSHHLFQNPWTTNLKNTVQEIAECLQQNAKSEKATAFLIWKALLFSVVALTTISEHLHHRIYFTVANILQSPVYKFAECLKQNCGD